MNNRVNIMSIDQQTVCEEANELWAMCVDLRVRGYEDIELAEAMFPQNEDEIWREIANTPHLWGVVKKMEGDICAKAIANITAVLHETRELVVPIYYSLSEQEALIEFKDITRAY